MVSAWEPLTPPGFFDTNGNLVDFYTWTEPATTIYGRCPNASCPFANTTTSTKGLVNGCATDVSFAVWSGGATIQTVGPVGLFKGHLSGLVYEYSGNSVPGILWAARNGPGSLFRLAFNGTTWAPDTANNWGAGKTLRYPNGSGDPDAEGVTFAGTGSGGGLFVSTERDNTANTVSRNAVLRFDGATLPATDESNLTADLPANGPNPVFWADDGETNGHALRGGTLSCSPF